MSKRTAPFAAFEWMIAWRYLRARRREGGVSTMSIISLLGVSLAVFALIATLSVRSGYRTQFVGTIIGANAHLTMQAIPQADDLGNLQFGFADYEAQAAALRPQPDWVRAAASRRPHPDFRAGALLHWAVLPAPSPYPADWSNRPRLRGPRQPVPGSTHRPRESTTPDPAARSSHYQARSRRPET